MQAKGQASLGAAEAGQRRNEAAQAAHGHADEAGPCTAGGSGSGRSMARTFRGDSTRRSGISQLRSNDVVYSMVLGGAEYA